MNCKTINKYKNDTSIVYSYALISKFVTAIVIKGTRSKGVPGA